MKASLLLHLLSPIGSMTAAGFVTNLLPPATMSPTTSSALSMEFPELGNWAPFKLEKVKDEQRDMKKKPRFKSRPLVDFQKDLEAGKVRYVALYPPVTSFTNVFFPNLTFGVLVLFSCASPSLL